MTKKLLPLAALATLLWCGSVAGQSFTAVPNGAWISDVTPDGAVVVGVGSGGGFYWRWQEEPLPTFVGGNDVTAVSDDGTVLVGCIQDPDIPGTGAEVAGMWTEATGWVSLGYLPNALNCPSRSNAYDISGDGTAVVGLSWDGCSGRGFLWTEATGMQELQPLANGGNRATTISNDGSAIGGFAQGSFSRTPAYWSADTSGAVLNPDFQGEVYGFSADGVFSVGTMYQGGGDGWYDAFVRTEADGMTNLGSIANGWAGNAKAITPDGTTIVGFDTQSLARRAWVWTEASGIVSMDNLLSSLGISAPSTLVCTAVSDDGNIIVGGHSTGGFSTGGFIVTLTDVIGTWTDLGNALAGAQGLPSLAGEGTLLDDASTTLELNNGLPGGSAALVLGLGQLNAAFKQGVMVPTLDVIIPGLPLDGAGSLSLQFQWATGIPSQTSLYWQYWITDPAGPVGFSASNGLQSTTP